MFSWNTVRDICDYLGISCFRVLKRTDDNKWMNPKDIDSYRIQQSHNISNKVVNDVDKLN